MVPAAAVPVDPALVPAAHPVGLALVPVAHRVPQHPVLVPTTPPDALAEARSRAFRFLVPVCLVPVRRVLVVVAVPVAAVRVAVALVVAATPAHSNVSHAQSVARRLKSWSQRG